LHTAFDRADALGCAALQVFTKNKGAWAARPLADDEVRAFRDRARSSRVKLVLAHAAYLINIASPSADLRRKSAEALRVEVDRCEVLGISYLVLHPGSHLGAGEEAGIKAAAASLDRVHAATRGYRTRILLETAAGQGSSICHRFAALGSLLARVRNPERLGACADTCHLFAAGYDLRSDEGYQAAMAELDREVGCERILCFHGNDSKRELGSRVDRHEHIGRGHLGRAAFRRLLRDARFAAVPLVTELPPENDMNRVNLAVLRRLAGRAALSTRAPTGGPFQRSIHLQHPFSQPRSGVSVTESGPQSEGPGAAGAGPPRN
jgi:deoxyribonuclease-4